MPRECESRREPASVSASGEVLGPIALGMSFIPLAGVVLTMRFC
jgi:hypothetical protein